MTTTETPLDLDARYTVAGYSGIAFYLLGYATEWTSEEWELIEGEDPDEETSYLYCEPEEVENRQMVRAVMVGDDHVHEVDVDDLTVIGELDYCAECGQIGCTGDFRDREES
jgi:hypothetical protein